MDVPAPLKRLHKLVDGISGWGWVVALVVPAVGGVAVVLAAFTDIVGLFAPLSYLAVFLATIAACLVLYGIAAWVLDLPRLKVGSDDRLIIEHVAAPAPAAGVAASPAAAGDLQADLAAWDLLDTMKIYQAAWLWDGQEPPGTMALHGRARVRAQMLAEAMGNGQLKVTSHGAYGQRNPNLAIVSKAQLTDFANLKGERPPFLFKEDR